VGQKMSPVAGRARYCSCMKKSTRPPRKPATHF